MKTTTETINYYSYPGIGLPLASRAECVSILHTLNDALFSTSE